MARRRLGTLRNSLAQSPKHHREVEAIDSNGIDVLVELDNGPDRGLRTFAMSELSFWSHGR